MSEITIDEFKGKMSERVKILKRGLPRQIGLCCERVRSTALNDMAKTPRNEQVSYGKKNHHPSLPGNAPAPDTGNLRASIHYTMVENSNTIIGIVGSDVEYGKILEYGWHNHKLAPRPWLKPALDKNLKFFSKTLADAIKKD